MPAAVWPPPRKRRRAEQDSQSALAPRTPLTGSSTNAQLLTPHLPTHHVQASGQSLAREQSRGSPSHSPGRISPLTSKGKNQHSLYRNGYVLKEKPPPYKPYSLNTPGQHRRQAFAFECDLPPKISPTTPLLRTQWSMLARGAKAIPLEGEVKELQMECSNVILACSGDICVIAPTGFGKSLLWTLPLLTLDRGVVLVVTPFTSLGEEGQNQLRRPRKP